ncbi:heparin lyase I family protein [Vibrio mangrovi]|uniref:Heparin lyase I family protein n=1 Tax=Vibrio mangrovi TaxID=474394 RepID=A0A1Y6IYV5_9VIBR|nr:heparin lyase I family protein [Vibrio mangrovi]MDW6002668.1 heparin lyase I family protein [Vibrio mangrovi]SMS02827.1 hypothetical protein VIM7927_04169 [Vibrio mangrovi]
MKTKIYIFIKAFTLLVLSFQVLAWTDTRNFNFGNDGDTAYDANAGFNDLAGASKIVKRGNGTPTLEGFSAAEINIRQGETGYGSWGGSMFFPEYIHRGEELWLQFYVYIPEDYVINTATGYLSLLRLRNIIASPDKTKKATGFLDIMFQNQDSTRGTFAVLKQGESSVKRIGNSASQPIPRDQWVKLELYVHADSVPQSKGGQGIVRLWMDDELVGEVSDIVTLGMANLNTKEQYEDGYFTRVMFFSYWFGGAPKTQKLYMDHVFMTNDANVPEYRDAQGHLFLGKRLARPVMVAVQAD